MACTYRLERLAWERGFRRVAGLDEAGRGCLFGPVFAAAVVLDPAKPIRGLNDSKQVPPELRDTLAVRIRERAVAWSVAKVDSGVIDKINIYQASRLAMKQALEQIAEPPDYLLVDALVLDTAIEQRSVIHGDALSRSIAAASILAKVERDASMAEWERLYPGYGFERHKGYSTPEHIEALTRLGPTPHHRYTYEPVRVAAGLVPEQLSLFAEGVPLRAKKHA
ncbi:MAG: ribonuclease HII [Bryobacteraceae bacterium]